MYLPLTDGGEPNMFLSIVNCCYQFGGSWELDVSVLAMANKKLSRENLLLFISFVCLFLIMKNEKMIHILNFRT